MWVWIVVPLAVVGLIVLILSQRRGSQSAPASGHASAVAEPPPLPVELATEPHITRRPPTYTVDLVDVFIDENEMALEGDTETFALVTAVGRTDPGKRRKHNEDSYLVLTAHDLYVIADGMGGYAAGEVASQLAVDTMQTAFEANRFEGSRIERLATEGDELVRAIRMANSAIFKQAQANEAQQGMGTTLVSCRFSRTHTRVYVAHVGDSRCYRLRDSKLELITSDHTLGAAGVVGPTANRLSRAVGIGEPVEVDIRVDRSRPGDVFVLCSDGLSKMVPDEMIRDVLLETTELSVAADRLVTLANEHGGRDNVTVIVIRVEKANA